MSAGDADKASRPAGRLAIVGGGSSGLVALKYALDALPEWDIACFEAGDRVTGSWGFPYRGFVSTSTKYTTQFACYPQYAAAVAPDGGASRSEFFRDGEYGAYLEAFADAFGLRRHIALRTCVTHLARAARGSGWVLTVQRGEEAPATEHFDAVILCTGLAAHQKRLDCDIPQLTADRLDREETLEGIRGRRIVVIGGGESAVDHANRLAAPHLGNRVFLSLHSGVRVSPRYHPIRGVPSDFLRNRLMLRIDRDVRNWIGQRFVEARIRYREAFERWFPDRGSAARAAAPDKDRERRRREWDFRLTRAAKDQLFSMFHNKSDDFLDAVGDGRIEIVGPPVDAAHRRYRGFDSEGVSPIEPDLIVPAIGYRSTVSELSNGAVRVRDFYLGCCHITHEDLYLVGFARPIIGNIPSMSEMQARYVTGLIAGRYARPADMERRHARDRSLQEHRYPKLDRDAVYPVEMFPYCDRLARSMGAMPRAGAVRPLRAWGRMQVAPATTMHYFGNDSAARRACDRSPVYMPAALIGLLLFLMVPSALYGAAKRLLRRYG